MAISAWLNTRLRKRADGVQAWDILWCFMNAYTCMDLFTKVCTKGSSSGSCTWMKACRIYPALSAHYLPPFYLFSSFHPSFRHPSHKPFYLETLVLQPSNAQKHLHHKNWLQRYNLSSWTVCVFKIFFNWGVQCEVPAKFSLGGRSFKAKNYFPHIK